MAKKKKRAVKKALKLAVIIFAIIIGIFIVYILVSKYNVSKNATIGLKENSNLNIEILDTSNERFKLDVAEVLQNPELPTGCEVTALTTVLNYYNYKVDKCTLADKYMPTNLIGTVTAWEAFIGNPHDEDGYGCFAPVICETAKKYLFEKDSLLTARDITGASKEELFSCVKAGKPVIVWATIDLIEPTITKYWGEIDFYWYNHEHCMVLIGYDTIKNTVIVSDPLHGIMEYDANLFMERYNYMYSMAVLIEPA